MRNKYWKDDGKALDDLQHINPTNLAFKAARIADKQSRRCHDFKNSKLSVDQNLSWGDGRSWNDVSPYECSGTPGPQINRPWWHNVPALIHPCHYALCNTYRLMQNGRDISMHGHCVSGTLHLGGPGIPENSYGDTSFRDVPSHHLRYAL